MDPTSYNENALVDLASTSLHSMLHPLVMYTDCVSLQNDNTYKSSIYDLSLCPWINSYETAQNNTQWGQG